MSKQVINLGTTPADGTGDKLRTAFGKVNANFDEVYEGLGNAISGAELDAHVEDTNNPHGVTKTQVGLGNVNNTSDANKPVSTAQQTALNAETAARTAADATNASAISVETAARIAADALKADLVGGVIPTAQIPAIAITTFLGSVASQAAMLALSGQSGDWCNRSDTSTAWVIIGSNPTQLSSWAQINYPASPVSSVNGQSGVIVLGKADVGLGNVNNTSDTNKPVSTAQQTALDLKQNRSSLGADSAAAVHAASSKTTPADSDEIGAADSAASFGLKRFTWANIKAALRSALKLDELAAPTDVTTLNATTAAHGLLPKLGGGTANFLRADGTWAAPAGGGSQILRGAGSLTGHTDPGGSATAPPTITLGFYSYESYVLEIFYSLEGSQQFRLTFSFLPMDPDNGTIWFDTSGGGGADGQCAFVVSFLTGVGAVGGFYFNVSGSNWITLDTTASGGGAYLNASILSGTSGVTISGGGSGSNEYPASGAVEEIVLANTNSVQKLYPLKIWGEGDGALSVDMDVCIKQAGTYYPLCTTFLATTPQWELIQGGSVATIGTNSSNWISNIPGGVLVARMRSSPAVGGYVTIFFTVERV